MSDPPLVWLVITIQVEFVAVKFKLSPVDVMLNHVISDNPCHSSLEKWSAIENNLTHCAGYFEH